MSTHRTDHLTARAVARRRSGPLATAVAFTASAMIALFSGPTAFALSYYWDGASASWNTAANWSTDSGATTPDPVTVPGAADDVVFNITTVNVAEAITLDAAQAANSLTFNNTGTTAITSGAGANTLTLGTGGVTIASGAGAATLNSAIKLGGNQSWINNSTTNPLVVSSTITNVGDTTPYTLTMGGSGDFRVNGIISNGGTTGTTALVKAGAGTLTLGTISGVANTFSGGMTINDGKVVVASAGLNGVGTGAIVIASGATLQFNTSTRGTTNTVSNVFTGAGTAKFYSSPMLVATGFTVGGSDFSGFTGTIQLSNNGVNGSDGSKLNLGTSTFNASGATVQIDSGNQLYYSGGANTATFGTIYVSGNGGNEGRGALRIEGGTLAGNIILQGSSAWGRANLTTGTITGTATTGNTQVLTIGTVNQTGNSTLRGVIGDGANGGKLALTMRKAGATLTLDGSAVNTYTGDTTVIGGILLANLNNLTTPTDLISNSSKLVLGGGTMSVTGKNGDGVSSSQTFASTTLNSGNNAVTTVLGTGTGPSTTLALQAITRNTGAMFNNTNTPNTTTLLTTTTGINGAGLPGSTSYIGAWATNSTGTNTRYLQLDSSGRFVAGPTSSTFVTSGGDANTVYNLNGNKTITGNLTGYGWLQTAASAVGIANNNVTLNGFININNSASSFTRGASDTGTIVVGAENELVVNMAAGNTLTVSVPIVNKASSNSNLTLTGSGGLTLNTYVSTYTGTTTVNSGTLTLGLNNVINSASSLVMNGGTVAIGATNQSLAGVKVTGGGTITGTTGVLTSASTYDIQNSGTISAILAGNVGLNKTTDFNATLSGANTFTGDVNIKAGTLNIATASNPSPLGNIANNVYLGDTSGIDYASLTFGNSITLQNPITVQSGSSGAKIIQTGGAIANAVVSGNITLNDDLYLWTNNSGAGMTLSGASINLGSKTLRITQGSNLATALTLSGTMTGASGSVNLVGNGTGTSIFSSTESTYGGGTVLGGLGTVQIDASSTGSVTKGPFGTGTVILNGVAVNAGITADQTIANAITIAENTTFATQTNETSLTFSGATTLANGDRTLTVNLGATVSGKGVTFSNAIGDNGQGFGLIKAGTGLLTFSGANTYSGGTTLTAGTLTVGTGGTLGATTGALTVNNPNTGAGTSVVLNLATGADTMVGSLSGTIATPSSGTNSATINNGGSGRNFTVNQTANGTYAGVIAGAGSFTLGGLSTQALTLSGANTYTGVTTVNGGTLILSGSSQTAGTVTIASGAVLELKNSTAFGSASVVTLTGTGTLRLNGATTYGSAADVINLGTGALIDLQAGTFNGGANSNKVYTSNLADLNVASGATFQTSNVAVRMDALSGSGTIDNSSSSTGGSFTFGVDNGSNTFSGALITSGANKFNFTKMGSGTQTLSGANTYTSTMNVNAGVLALSGSGTLGGSTAGVSLGGGQLDLGGLSPAAIGAVSVTTAYASGDTIKNGSLTGSSYSVSNTTGNVVISANLDGAAATLSKSGDGTLTLSGANSYSGLTTISAGTLTLGASDVLANAGAVTVSGGTLSIGANSDTVGAVTLTSGSITGSTGVLTGASYAVESGSISAILGGTSVALTKSTAGTVTLSGTNTYTGATTISGGGILSVSTIGNQAESSNVGAGTTINIGGASSSGTLLYTGTAKTTTRIINMSGGTTGSDVIIDQSGTGLLKFTNNFTNVAASISKTLTIQGSTTGTGEISGVIQEGTGGMVTGLVKAGSGTWTLSGANTYTGGTTLSAGTLQGQVVGTSLTPTSPLGTGTIALNGGTLQLRASGTVNTTAETITFGNNVSVGADTTIDVNRPGATSTTKTIALGSLSIGANTLNVTGGNSYGLRFTGATTLTGNAIFSPATANVTLAGLIGETGGARSITKTGSGTLTLSLSDAVTPLASTFSGGAIISAGTLTLANPLGTGGAVTTPGGDVSGVYYLGDTSGAATATLSIANNNITFNNPITVRAGSSGTKTFSISGTSVGLSNSGTITLDDNLTLSVAPTSSSLNLSGVIQDGTNGAKGITLVAGSGVVTLSNTNTYTGTTTVTGATLLTTKAAALPGYNSSGKVVVNGGTLAVRIGGSGWTEVELNSLITNATKTSGNLGIDTTNGNFTPSSAFDIGALGLVKNGSNILTLDQANSFTGSVTVNAGTLRIANSGALGTGNKTLSSAGGSRVVELSGGVTLGSNISLSMSSNSGDGLGLSSINGDNVIQGNITYTSGNPAFNISSSGTSKLTISGNVTYTVANNTRIMYLGGDSTAANVISGNVGQSGTAAILRVHKQGVGTWELNGTNSYTGDTQVNGGILSVNSIADGGSNSSIGASTSAASNLVFGGGTLRYTGGTVVSDRAFTITADKTAVLDVATAGTSLSLAGATGTATNGALTKLGTGTLALTGVNTYTGATTVNAGTLKINGSLANTAVTLNNSGTILTGSGSIAGAVTVNSGAIIAPGNDGIGTLTSGDQTWNAGGYYSWDVAAATGTPGTDWDKLSIANLDLSSLSPSNTFTINVNDAGLVGGWNTTDHTWTIATANSFTTYTGDVKDLLTINHAALTSASGSQWYMSIAGSNLIVNYIVPEPGTLGLLAFGALALLGRRRRDRK